MRWYMLLLISAIAVTTGYADENCKPKIAIVGGGIGGASTSHFLSELFNNNVEIDLYETKTLGGRLANIEIDKREYEAGGSIIHSENKYMQDFLKLLGLEERASKDEISGIWNGKQFVFEESHWKVISMAKLFYRYGLQPLKLQRYISTILTDFSKIYKLQESGQSFENVTGMMSAMNTDFPKYLQIPGRKHFLSLGYQEEFIDEIIHGAMTVDYGQSSNTHSFVNFVSLAAVTGHLWAVKGGNKQVPKHLIYRNTNVHVVPSTVSKIKMLNADASGKYELHYSNKDSTNVLTSIYDIVILATPLTSDYAYPIIFEGFANDFTVPGKYHTTVATFVKAKLNPSYFGLNEEIDSIMSCDPKSTIISSVGRLSTVNGEGDDGDHSVWKVFSNAPVEENLIEKIFSDIQAKQEIRWKAYPEYSTDNRHDKFKLDDGLYHVNAIEWAASAMEMSAIGGRNVALLAHRDFTQKCGKYDKTPPKLERTDKVTRSTEL